MDVPMSHAPRRSALSLLTFIVLASSAGCAPASTDGAIQRFSCDFAEADSGASGSGAVEVRDGEVQSLTVQTHFPGLPGKWGYSCLLDASRGDQESTWTAKGAETRVDFERIGAYRDRVRIVPLPGGYRIDLRDTRPTGKCGAGAELPREMTILETGAQCRTVWDE